MLYQWIIIILIAISTGNTFAQDITGLNLLGTFHTGLFDVGGSEILTYDAVSQRLFSTNRGDSTIDIIHIADPAIPRRIKQVSMTGYGFGLTCVASYNGIIAATVPNDSAQLNGVVVFLDTGGNYIAQVLVGAMPKMLCFTPDGGKLLVANEGEAAVNYDPEGSISIIDVSGGVVGITQAAVKTIGFTAFNATVLDSSIRIYGSGNGSGTVAEDLEPEYIAVSPDGSMAYVTCQENNAVAVVDLNIDSIIALTGLGFKNHNLAGNGIDASDLSGSINITTWPVWGMYQPDGAATFDVAGSTYLIIANEGSSRSFEKTSVDSIMLDDTVFTNIAFLQNDTALGRLRISNAMGDIDGDGKYEKLYCFGGRSFSIWNTATGTMVYDSGDELEQIIAAQYPKQFNSNNFDNNSFKSRSENKGPEPEVIEIAEIGGKVYAFIGLERMGGIMLFDVTNPAAPVFINYILNRNFTVPATSVDAGDLGPEDIVYIPDTLSPNGKHLLAVSNEVSGTLSIYEMVDWAIGIDDADNDRRGFMAYPNPNNSGIVCFNKTVSVTVYDLVGQKIERIENQSSHRFSHYKPGIYLLVTDEGEMSKLYLY